MQNPTQKQIVMEIVKNLAPVRTEIIKIEGMRKGVSCADRYLRWLQEEGKITSYKKHEDRTKTWVDNGVQKSLF